jgi:ComF family protein
MFPAVAGAVNLEDIIQSTIGMLRVTAGAGAGLPPWLRWSFRLLPGRCLVCQAVADLPCLDLCERCLTAWPFLSLEPFGTSDRGSHEGTTFAPFAFATPIDAALRELKYRADWRWAAVLGAVVAARALVATQQSAFFRLPDLFVPVPLHAERRRARGFNQASKLANALGRRLAIPVWEHALRRPRATAAQTGLSAAARHDNVRDAFRLTPGIEQKLLALRANRATLSIALVDDVLTTGATLDAAATPLRGLGGVELQRWAIARTIPTSTTSPT